jgi:ketosteroid isomerase-like protein
MTIADDFHQTLQQVRIANQHFLVGDPAPYKACWSHADDVTIFGGWGAYEKGWEQVDPRLDWAAARFLEGQRTIELLSMAISENLAYTVWVERGETRVVGSDELRPSGLRVTHIFRREEGAWKIIHRHADAIMQKIEATATQQQ